MEIRFKDLTEWEKMDSCCYTEILAQRLLDNPDYYPSFTDCSCILERVWSTANQVVKRIKEENDNKDKEAEK